MPDNYFNRFAALDVQGYLEKKGQFTYLSWAHAVAILRMHDPAATWQVRRFDGLPFLRTETGYFVEVAVTVQGIELSQIHPVLDGKNRVIAEPTAFDINTSIQRCLVKAIALHGLGLYIYAGEDLPQIGTDPAANDPAAVTLSTPATPATPAVPVGKAITVAQQATIRKLTVEVGVELPRVLEYFGVQALAEIPVSNYLRVVRSLEKRRAA